MASSARPPEVLRVAIFAKAPVPGTVKTRLVPRLGDAGAARLHAALVRNALATAKAAGVGLVELWCAPSTTHAFFAECARDTEVSLHAQAEGDLGARMQAAFARAHALGAGLVLIGSDCPALTASCLRHAAMALASTPAAIAPAEDGGYALIALAAPCPALFDAMPWGSDRVMAETRRRLAASRTPWTELATTWDVDRPEDYDRLLASGLLDGVAA